MLTLGTVDMKASSRSRRRPTFCLTPGASSPAARGGTSTWRLPNGTNVSNSTGKLGKGLDIRTTGGYVVAPPSIHISGKAYSWLESPEDAPLAPAPTWLIDKLKPQPPAQPFAVSNSRTSNSANAEARVTAILLKVAGAAAGERNQLTFWAASRVRDLVHEGVIDHCAGMDVLTQLRQAAAHAGLAPLEINSTITSALRKTS